MGATLAEIDPDAGLVSRAREGDSAALDSLIRRYQSPVRSYLRRLLGESEAEDAAQDVFLRLSQNLHTFREGFRFSTWLFAVAVNRARDLLRKRKVREAELPAPTGEETLLTREEDRQLLSRAVRSLPLELSEPLLLVYQQGMTHAEAAEALGLETGAVKMRVHRAIRHLRAAMKREES